jgi:hypothetical protein
MKRAVLTFAALILVAATPQEVLPELEASGFYIEDGSDASIQVVSDAVFEGRSDGGRLYIVVLAEEPPGGATTFSDSTLDLLDDDGYVVTIAPETVGFAGEGTAWNVDEVNEAIDQSLDGGSDDEVVQIFIGALTGQTSGDDGDTSDEPSSAGGTGILWVLVVIGAVAALWVLLSRRSDAKRSAGRMEKVKELAKQKLDDVANDILEMEDEVTVSENAEAKGHYQRASAMYTKAMEDNDRAGTLKEMLDVSEELDLAIWELDCAEALLDGKAKPPKPGPPKAEPGVAQPVPESHGQPLPSVPGTVDQFDRRPERRSSGSSDMMTMLMTMMAMRTMGGRGGRSGGWTGGGFPTGGGGRMGGGGRRMGGGGGRMRGGGRRRG